MLRPCCRAVDFGSEKRPWNDHVPLFLSRRTRRHRDALLRDRTDRSADQSSRSSLCESSLEELRIQPKGDSMQVNNRVRRDRGECARKTRSSL